MLSFPAHGVEAAAGQKTTTPPDAEGSSQPSAAAQAATSHQAETYAAVAPLLARRCVLCHNPRGSAPFSLLSYDDAKQWGEQMLEVTQSRYMPPWLPAPGRGSFVGERRLTDSEIATIHNWVASGMPPAPGTLAPPPPQPAGAAGEGTAWAHGKPDLILDLPQPIDLPGSGSDLFLNLLVPYSGTAKRMIRTVELHASDPQALRSIWLQVDRTGALRRQHPDDWKSGIPGMEPPAALQKDLDADGNLLFWTPDAPVVDTERTPWRLDPGNDLVLTTHLKTTGRAEQVKLQIGLYYAGNKAPRSEPLVLTLAHAGAIEIPADSPRFTLEDTVTLPEAVNVTAIYPQAHLLGRQLDAWAILPRDKKVWLISIPRWDVDWQSAYRYTAPVALPKGAVVHWQYTYDNSTGNPHNPNDPPKSVSGGDAADQELDRLLLQVTPQAGHPDSPAWREHLLRAAAH